MKKLSIAQLTIDPVSPAHLVTLAANAGLDAIGLRLWSSNSVGSQSQPVLAAADVLEVKRRLNDTGLYILDATALWLTPETAVDDFEAVLDRAAELKVKFFLVAVMDQDRERALDRFRQTCQRAATRNLNLALEFMSYSAVNSLEDAGLFVAMSGMANTGIVVDALHLSRSGGTVRDLETIDPNKISFVQLCDAALMAPPKERLRNEAITRRLYPGQGELPLLELLRAVPKETFLDIEAPCLADLSQTAEVKLKNAVDATRTLLALVDEQ